MLQPKALRDKGFEMTMPRQVPTNDQGLVVTTSLLLEKQETFFRPNESNRAARAKRWIEKARGKAQEPRQ